MLQLIIFPPQGVWDTEGTPHLGCLGAGLVETLPFASLCLLMQSFPSARAYGPIVGIAGKPALPQLLPS